MKNREVHLSDCMDQRGHLSTIDYTKITSVFVCELSRSIYKLLTDRTSVSVMFQKLFQKWTSRFWVMRSNSAPLSSGSMAYFPELKKELAATPWREIKSDTMRGVC
uniref:Uncharacterized protein n=1 Tax=Labrus bergylta TaxID=56723 RepID=A0A3Q3EG78_9LABR